MADVGWITLNLGDEPSMNHPLVDKHILLGVTGSIAAYKAADLASRLTQAGALVDVILTPAAEKFVTPLTFQSVTGRKAFTDADLWGGEGHVTHIGLGRGGDILLIAPVTATTMAKLAHGIGDNLLTVAALATHGMLVLAPAMDAGMYDHPATQDNIQVLKKRGAHFIGPVEGRMASGLIGLGRFAEPSDIVSELRALIGKQAGQLKGKKVIVTAGGTQEALDPVRFITNRSSGKQGYAIAQAAVDAGADVTLISAPTALPIPAGVRLLDVHSAADMLDVVLKETRDADALIMAAAVSDYTPVHPADQKIKKTGADMALELQPTTDILKAVARQRSAGSGPIKVIGFAAETQSLIENAARKLAEKKLDMIVANDVSAGDAGFEVDTNRVTLLFPDGKTEALQLSSKQDIAWKIIDILTGWLI
jgi:phosphopantothenoylcysteine decarboxylase/phosphopantothenate--cysteine ligase